MEIIIADNAGFCYGVKRAVEMAFENGEKGVYSLGELVHNPQVVDELSKKGVVDIESPNIRDSKVIIRSHGVHKSIREGLIENGNELIDCVCPSVHRIYKIVEEHYNDGYNIVILGNPTHPEVIGINSYCNDTGVIIENESQVKNIDPSAKTCVVSQTTNNVEMAKNIVNKIKNVLKAECLVYNTICGATHKRQFSAIELAKTVDAMIVLGGKNSSNTKKLKEVSSQYCGNVYLVESIKNIDINILRNFKKIGITAGASTPDWVIKEAVSIMENFDNNEMMEAIENSFTRIRRGEIVKGEVLFVTDNEVMVNINYRSDGIIARDELSKNADVKPADMFKPGDEIEVYILKMDDGDGNVVLSHKKVESMKVWDDIEKLFEEKELVNVKVKASVKGGLTADLMGINAFIPASHVSVRFQKDLTKYVGQELLCEIIDFDKSKRKIVLSRKNVEEKELEEKRKAVYESLQEGDIIEGVVQRITNFGAFVDVGGVDGLIHISEMSWNRIKHPSSVVSPGQTVKVQVLSLDEEKNRIALGLKQTTEKPWDVFVNSVNVGDVVEGKVVNLLDFGAFIRIESGVDGLLHVSEIAKEHIEKPEDRLSLGEEVTVKVTDINEDDKKISLSIKALFEDEEEEEEEYDDYDEVEEVEEYEEEVVEEPVRETPKQEDFNTTLGDLFNINLDTEE